MPMPIGDIFDLCGTDKHKSHAYGPTYDRLFSPPKRECVNSVLEFGVSTGQSMKAWTKVFPNAQIVGVDKLDLYQSESKRIQIIKGDVLTFGVFEQVKRCGLFDVIIDDASHAISDQISAMSMYWQCLRRGGVYIIEEFAWYLYGPELGEKRGQMAVRVKE